MYFQEDYQKIKAELEEVEKQLSSQSVALDLEKMRDFSRRYSELKELMEKIEELWLLEKNKQESQELADQESDEEMKDFLLEEVLNSTEKIVSLERKISRLLLPPDPNDTRSAFLEIRSGAGGEEAALFAAELFRSYALYAQLKNWKVEIVSQNISDLGGAKEIVAFIAGRNVYGTLKNESGVHRVQRVPETEKNGRIHTSTITVAVLPEAEKAEIAINPSDIRVDVFRSSGPGGQSVNTTDSAVRITHLPTGLVVSCQDQKSQHKNKDKALQVLSARLLAFEEEKKHREISDLRSSQVGTGDRSEKIRTYNYPQNRITDHRLKKSWHNLEEIMQGKIGEVVEEG